MNQLNLEMLVTLQNTLKICINAGNDLKGKSRLVDSLKEQGDCLIKQIDCLKSSGEYLSSSDMIKLGETVNSFYLQFEAAMEELVKSVKPDDPVKNGKYTAYALGGIKRRLTCLLVITLIALYHFW